MFGLGLTEILVIGSLGVLFFGARNLPKLGSSLGESLRSFKKGLSEEEKKIRDVEELKKKQPPDR
jgi:sec-independent protein translocase protein TatA